MCESVSGTVSNSVFAIQFSHKDKYAKTRRDESNKTQKTKTKEERKKNLERERKKDLSLSLCVCVSSTTKSTYLTRAVHHLKMHLSFFLSFSLEKN